MVFDSNKNVDNRYMEDNLHIKINKSYISVSHKEHKRIFTAMKDEFKVENGMIIEPVKYYATVEEYKSGLNDRIISILDKYNVVGSVDEKDIPFADGLISISSGEGNYDVNESFFVYPKISTMDSNDAKGVINQFAESISIDFSDIWCKENSYDNANNLYDFMNDYTGVNLGDKNLFNEYVRSVGSGTFLKDRVFSTGNEFFANYEIYEYPLITSPLIKVDIYSGYFRIHIPVIAEGKGYI